MFCKGVTNVLDGAMERLDVKIFIPIVTPIDDSANNRYPSERLRSGEGVFRSGAPKKKTLRRADPPRLFFMKCFLRLFEHTIFPNK